MNINVREATDVWIMPMINKDTGMCKCYITHNAKEKVYKFTYYAKPIWNLYNTRQEMGHMKLQNQIYSDDIRKEAGETIKQKTNIGSFPPLRVRKERGTKRNIQYDENGNIIGKGIPLKELFDNVDEMEAETKTKE